MTDIRSIGTRTNNAELIADAAVLGYLAGHVLDASYGEGRFWTRFAPAVLTANDIDTESLAEHHYDFRRMPWDADTFDSVVLDAPYKLNGTGGGSGPATSDGSYGVAGAYRTVEEKHQLIKSGMMECARVTRTFLLVKCMDQVCSGRKWWQTMIFTSHGEALGLTLADMLHVQGYRRQPEGRRQVHSRGDYSTLLVFRK